jgi:hypothetical protein
MCWHHLRLLEIGANRCTRIEVVSAGALAELFEVHSAVGIAGERVSAPEW